MQISRSQNLIIKKAQSEAEKSTTGSLSCYNNYYTGVQYYMSLDSRKVISNPILCILDNNIVYTVTN